MPQLLKRKLVAKKGTVDTGNPLASTKGKQSKLKGFFSLKPIVALRTTDPEFVFVTDLGIKIKHLKPISKEMSNDFDNLKKSYMDELDKMKVIRFDTNFTDEEKRTQLRDIGVEAKELSNEIEVYNSAKRESENDRQKVESAVLSA